MSYYGPQFANIASGWFRQTKDPIYASGRDRIEKCWNQKCDDILRGYVKKYGTFFTAFSSVIAKDISELIGVNIEETIRYFEYYLASKAFELVDTRALWLESHANYAAVTFTCRYCTKSFPLLNSHPDLIRALGVPPPHCRTCNYVVQRYRAYWSPEFEIRAADLLRVLAEERKCELCDTLYSLENDVFTYDTFGNRPVDCLHPNLYVNICQRCFGRVFNDYARGSAALRLKRLYELFKFTGKVPTQDFDKLLYSYRDRDSMFSLIKILSKMRTPLGYKEEHGSFFAALVKSGILPDGSRRMSVGTMVVSNDGHLCFSLAEKEIDDFLHSNGIPHHKEVHYPGTKLRADWELFVAGARLFVEYFGLMSNRDYATKAALKEALAKQHQIRLIAIYPNDDWEELLSEFIGTSSK